MSDIVEKTLSSIPKFFSQNLLGAAVTGPPSPRRRFSSRAFQTFVVQLNSAKTFSEEEQYVRNELLQIRQKISHPDITASQMCEILCKLIYCGILGYDVSFGYIHAVKLAQQGSAFEKRMGYIACTILLHEDHELILLLINTIQKDLQSTNILDNLASLSAVCCLVNKEMITEVLPSVQQKLKHPREIVRAKAVQCIHSFLHKSPALVSSLEDGIRQSLTDKDPSVMVASLNVWYDIIMKNHVHGKYADLFSPMKEILRQIISRSLPSSFEYHGIPLPWSQIKLLRILSLLAHNNKRLSEELYPLISDLLQKVNIKEKMALAIMHECIQAITTIQANPSLLEEATTLVKKFVTSTSFILKYMGVKSLTSLITTSPKSAMDCQMMVVELLEDPDPLIQRKTVDLLYGMANPSNAQVVCNKLLEQVPKAHSQKWKKNLVRPSNKQSLTSTAQKEYHQHLVKKSIESLFIEDCSQELILLCVWVVGEFATFLKKMPEDKIVVLLKSKYQQLNVDTETRIWIVNSLLKLASHSVVNFEAINKEFAILAEEENSLLLKQMDFSLSFLDDYVVASLEKGESPYLHLNQRHPPRSTVDTVEDHTGLFEGLGDRERADSAVSTERTSQDANSSRSLSDTCTSSSQRDSGLKMKGVRRVWGKDGIIRDGQKGMSDDMVVNSEKNFADKEQIQRKRELAAALFSGVTDTKDTKEEEEEEVSSMDPFLIDEDSSDLLGGHNEDTGGWRQLHRSNISEDILPQTEDNNVISPSEQSEEQLLMNTVSMDAFKSGYKDVDNSVLLVNFVSSCQQNEMFSSEDLSHLRLSSNEISEEKNEDNILSENPDSTSDSSKSIVPTTQAKSITPPPGRKMLFLTMTNMDNDHIPVYSTKSIIQKIRNRRHTKSGQNRNQSKQKQKPPPYEKKRTPDMRVRPGAQEE
ncbi:hypothetical protein FSP39_025479 [Pinctada imbricata]|uniref:Clathrin/coatomer adaptor adaptin-like N-terminal domain-containing protein n=1 Tax=Pinctada imbricata TaxID=66713 RepID=A0AA89BUD9_PINIB|nr:hypothetical protein FSP39_025479 [Pinctada imbricata]